jgi:uncharacterized protein YhaN
MKIDQLQIDGFGLFHNKQVVGFQPGINVLYGPNEAGKSTLLDFIRFTLFEYPRFKDDRRPPLSGGEHGGRLFLQDSSNRPFSIYRNGNGKKVSFEMQGKATDNLSAYQQLIGNASIALYRNVYAITLDELLHLDQLDESGMEDRIFSMGMGLAGVDFGKFEKGLIKEADRYFKSRGKNQVLIELVDQIATKETAIMELRSKLNRYNRFSEQKEQLERELAEFQEKRQQLSALKNKYTDYSRAYESFVTYQSATEKLESYGELTILDDTIKDDFKENEAQIAQLENSAKEIKRKINQLSEELTALNWDEELADHIAQLDYLKSNVKLYEEARTNVVQSKDKLNAAKSSTENIMQRLGNQFDLLMLLKLEGSFELKSLGSKTVEAIQATQRQLDNQTERLNGLTRNRAKLAQRYDSITAEIEAHTISNDQARTQTENKRIELDTAFKKALQGNVSTQKKSRASLILTILFLIVGAGLFAENLIAAGIVTAIALISLIVVLVTGKKGSVIDISQDATALNKEIEQLKTDLEKYDLLRKESNRLLQELESVKAEAKTAAQEQNESKKTLLNFQEKWVDTLHEKGLPAELSAQHIGDFLGNVEELKRLNQQVQETEENIRINIERIQSFEEGIKAIKDTESPLETAEVYAIIKSLEKAESVSRKREQLIKDSTQLERELEKYSEHLDALNKVQNETLANTGFDVPESLYAHFKRQETAQALKEQQEAAAKTIKTICGSSAFEETIKELQKYTPTELNTRKEVTDNEYEEVKQRYDEINREVAAITRDIRHILEPDDMYALQNQKESLQEQLKSETKAWLATKLSLEILNESKQRYEKERQPEVITQTRKYFKAITENAYEDLRISLSDRHVSIIDDRGKQKTVNELSRGTREQLLLALRLGLIEEYEKNAEPLPVALDDIMVNFDVHRSENLAKVLTDFAKERQVILFTCHKHTRDLFQKQGATIIDWRA